MRFEPRKAGDIRMEAAVIFDSYLPDALRRALEYAGDDGFVASMPQLLHARANAPYDNEIWSIRSFASYSEESVVRTRQGNHVVVAVHGGGVFASPERFRTLYHASTSRFSELGFTGLFGARISETEARSLLDGKLPAGNEVPVFFLCRVQERNLGLAAAIRGRPGLRIGEELQQRQCVLRRSQGRPADDRPRRWCRSRRDLPGQGRRPRDLRGDGKLALPERHRS